MKKLFSILFLNVLLCTPVFASSDLMGPYVTVGPDVEHPNSRSASTGNNIFQTDNGASSTLVHQAFPHTAQTTTVTLSGTSSTVQLVSAASAYAVTLPAASSCADKIFVFKKPDANTNAITVTAAGSDTIDGAATAVLNAQYQELWIQSDGSSKWNILGITSAGGSSGLTNGGAKSSSFTAAANSYYQVTGTATCTLPTAVGVGGQSIQVFVASGGAVTFNTTSSQTINSASNHASGALVDSNQGNMWIFISDNSNWDLQLFNVGI